MQLSANIPNDILEIIQRTCQTSKDEPRWLVALISDTGMRLSEAAGLSKGDIYLDEEAPYVDIKPQRQLIVVNAAKY